MLVFKTEFKDISDHMPKGIRFNQPTRTKQSFKDECNINNIMAKYATSGVITHVSAKPLMYGDASEIPDYQQALNMIINAKESFMSLPSAVRKRFNNDPAEMMDFLRDPRNAEEAVKLGLFVKKEEVVSNPVTVDPPAEKPAENSVSGS